jgi:hypothetical protein
LGFEPAQKRLYISPFSAFQKIFSTCLILWWCSVKCI